MEMERRASVIPSKYCETTLKEDDDKRNDKVTLPISKRMVYNSYLKVMAKDGSAGIDQQSIEQFNESMSGNLYKIWNRMTSGSYFPPPVRTVFIPKKQGGTRPLGIPTVSDRTYTRCSKRLLRTCIRKMLSSKLVWIQTRQECT